ncbi:hypothetical protein DFR29_1033 [Tahibacter aquaticus]|uniref:Uncharacterized protein n=1 Tax=Tahibacter aquaticus TaxID=520092 RepID=A0A4R6Z493_9GAMM|nr:hypothetical protein [Tahibacter aquaticus]TDR46472.1 hypothetical protein DFR29_1033 [Tahibacter aquaticus]
MNPVRRGFAGIGLPGIWAVLVCMTLPACGGNADAPASAAKKADDSSTKVVPADAGSATAASAESATAPLPATVASPPPAPPPSGPPAGAPIPVAAEKPAGKSLGTGTLSYPDDFQIELLVDRILGRNPPFDDWAAAAVSRREADEFTDRERLLAEARKPFEAMFAATADIGVLRLRLRSQFSQYDADRKIYYLTAFSPGNTLTFRSGKYSGEQVTLQLDNLSQAQAWPMEPAAAQALLKRHPGRTVSLDVTVDLTGAQMRSSGPQLNGRIRTFDIHGNDQLITTREL